MGASAAELGHLLSAVFEALRQASVSSLESSPEAFQGRRFGRLRVALDDSGLGEPNAEESNVWRATRRRSKDDHDVAAGAGRIEAVEVLGDEDGASVEV